MIARPTFCSSFFECIPDQHMYKFEQILEAFSMI